MSSYIFVNVSEKEPGVPPSTPVRIVGIFAIRYLTPISSDLNIVIRKSNLSPRLKSG